MRTLKVQQLSLEKFAKYGSYAQMLSPTGNFIGKNPVEFYRDMVVATLPGGTSGVSVTKVYPRDLVIGIAEYHDHTGEIMMPLDGDVLIHVAPASPHGVVPYDEFEVFRVPMGTSVVLRPGVWHHAPFCIADKPVNNLVILPERTYANDCTAIDFPPDQRFCIEM